MDTQRYKALMDAAVLLAAIQREISILDGPATSPAWSTVFHAQRYCERQAAEVFRAEEVSA